MLAEGLVQSRPAIHQAPRSTDPSPRQSQNFGQDFRVSAHESVLVQLKHDAVGVDENNRDGTANQRLDAY